MTRKHNRSCPSLSAWEQGNFSLTREAGWSGGPCPHSTSQRTGAVASDSSSSIWGGGTRARGWLHLVAATSTGLREGHGCQLHRRVSLQYRTHSPLPRDRLARRPGPAGLTGQTLRCCVWW